MPRSDCTRSLSGQHHQHITVKRHTMSLYTVQVMYAAPITPTDHTERADQPWHHVIAGLSSTVLHVPQRQIVLPSVSVCGPSHSTPAAAAADGTDLRYVLSLFICSVLCRVSNASTAKLNTLLTVTSQHCRGYFRLLALCLTYECACTDLNCTLLLFMGV